MHPAVTHVARRTWAVAAAPDVRRALPYALVLALALGATLVVGANLSNAFPSESRPFGWEGPSAFENGVAMVRPDIVLATTLPALLLGARALEGRAPGGEGLGSVLRVYATHAFLLALGIVAAAGLGAWGSFDVEPVSFLAFSVVHTLLALAFYSLAFAWSASLRRHALPAAVATWGFFVLLYDSLVKWRVFREAGYHRLAAGDFPEWFYAAQALSPLTAYRGALILWQERFMDAVEKALLGEAPLPPWVNPLTFSSLLVALWIALPLGVALGAWSLRRRRERAAAAAAA